MYEWAAAGHVPWQWQGRPVGPEGFRDTIWTGVLTHCVIEAIEKPAPIGLFTAYGANHHHQICYCQIGMLPEWRLTGLPAEAGLLGLDLLFRHHPFRKIYAEVGSDKFHLYESGIPSGFVIEGRFKDHLYSNDEYLDLITLSVSRDVWRDRLVPLIERLTSNGSH